MSELKHCPHAHRCVHPCDDDECFLETIEEPNGPVVPLTKEECDQFETDELEYVQKQQSSTFQKPLQPGWLKESLKEARQMLENDDWKRMSVTAIAAENPSVAGYIAALEKRCDKAEQVTARKPRAEHIVGCAGKGCNHPWGIDSPYACQHEWGCECWCHK